MSKDILKVKTISWPNQSRYNYITEIIELILENYQTLTSAIFYNLTYIPFWFRMSSELTTPNISVDLAATDILWICALSTSYGT